LFEDLDKELQYQGWETYNELKSFTQFCISQNWNLQTSNNIDYSLLRKHQKTLEINFVIIQGTTLIF